MKKLFFLGAIISTCFSYAQPFYKHWDVTGFAGTSHYSGEIANETSFTSFMREMRVQGGLALNYNVSKESSIGAEVVFGNWYANDLNHQNLYERSYEGTSNYLQLSLQFKHYFFTKGRSKFSPYLGAGAGISNNNTTITALEVARTSPTPLQANNSTTNFGITLSAGIMYNASKNVSLCIEPWLALYPSDNIDNLIYAEVEADKIASIRFKLKYRLVR